MNEVMTTVATDTRGYLIHTDGACRGNPGPGAWACVLRLMEGQAVIKEAEYSDGEEQTTNNRMELMARCACFERVQGTVTEMAVLKPF